MNKLTEIKEAMEEMKKFQDEYVQADEYYKDVTYLLSLLEEKDKALEFYADKENWWLDAPGFIDLSIAEKDSGNIARKALNTSSNSEGE